MNSSRKYPMWAIGPPKQVTPSLKNTRRTSSGEPVRCSFVSAECAAIVMGPSCVIEERHEPEIHMQLLMTVKERQPRIVGHEIKLQLLKPAQHHHVLDHPGGRFAGDARQLEAVAVQVQRVDVVARIAEFQAVAASLMHRVYRLPGLH